MSSSYEIQKLFLLKTSRTAERFLKIESGNFKSETVFQD